MPKPIPSSRRRARLGARSTLLAAACAALGAAPAAAQFFQTDAAALPPEPKAGECYARVLIPARSETRPKIVVTKEASEALEVRQAEYRWVTRDVEIESAAERVEIVPAIYETRAVTVEIEPEREVVEALPPVYETITEQVLVRPAYTMWKKGEGPIQKIDLATGEIMCLVEVPAEYETVERQVVRIPARTVVKTVPAVTETVEVKVMTRRPRVRRIPIAAVTKPMRVMEMVRDWEGTPTPIPEETVALTETLRVEPQRMAWRPILCETNSKPGLVRELQEKLKSAGYNPGPLDGKLGPATLRALTDYQKENGLAQGNVTIETLEALDIDHRA